MTTKILAACMSDLGPANRSPEPKFGLALAPTGCSSGQKTCSLMRIVCPIYGGRHIMRRLA